MNFTDTHCHLYLDDFKEDIDAVMQRAIQAGVTSFYLPSIDSSTLNNLFLFEEKYTSVCKAMIGLHPCSVKENVQEELQTMEQHLHKRSFAAIGEIGLDFYWSTTFEQAQYEAFEAQMQWALQKNLPIVIHTRNAMQATINFVKPYAKKGLKGIFHCFSGTVDEAEQIIDMNFLLGIGGVVTFKNSGLADTVALLPLESIVLETDAPYLSPVPFRGKRNESSYLIYVAEKMAAIKNISLEEVAEITTYNAKNIFAL